MTDPRAATATASKGLLVVFGLLLALTAALAFWTYRNAEFDTVDTLQHGFRGEALSNRFYAGRELLRRLGADAVTVTAPPGVNLLGQRDTLLLSVSGRALGTRYADALLGWVAAGGRLIVVPQADLTAADPLLDALGLDLSALDNPADRVVTVSAAGRDYRLRWRGQTALSDPDRRATTQLGGPLNGYGFIYRYGNGTVIALADLSAFTNPLLGELDHADFFWAVLAGGSPLGAAGGGKIWLQRAPAVPSLFTLLWRNAWPLLIGLAATLIAVGWAANLRLGPVVTAAELDNRQRSLIEHLAASGRFALHHGLERPLLLAARERLVSAVQRRYPHWPITSADDQASIAELMQRLAAAHPELDRVTLQQALGQQPQRRGDLLATVRALQTLYRHLK